MKYETKKLQPKGAKNFYRNMSDCNRPDRKKPIIVSFDLDDTLIRTNDPVTKIKNKGGVYHGLHKIMQAKNLSDIWKALKTFGEPSDLPDYPAHYRDARSECYIPIQEDMGCAYLPNEFYTTLKKTLTDIANISGTPVIPLIVTNSTEGRAKKIIRGNSLLADIFTKDHIFARISEDIDIDAEDIIKKMNFDPIVNESLEEVLDSDSDLDLNRPQAIFKEDPLYQIHLFHELKKRGIIDFSFEKTKDMKDPIRWVHIGDNKNSDYLFLAHLPVVNHERESIYRSFIHTSKPDDQNEIYAKNTTYKDIWEALKTAALKSRKI